MPDLTNRPSPLSFHERTRMVLDPAENVLQQELDRFQVECDQGNFCCKQKKDGHQTVQPLQEMFIPTGVFPRAGQLDDQKCSDNPQIISSRLSLMGVSS